MKSMKKVLALVLSLAVAFSVMTATPVTTQAKLKIMSGKNIKLTLGKNEQIYLNNAKGVKFKTSNKKVATVSKKGKVVAKGVGSCKITITKGKEKLTSNVKVALAKVKEVVGELSGVTTAKLEFEPVKGASGYVVYKSNSASGKFTKAATSTGTTAYVKNLPLGQKNYFKVKASKGKVVSFEYSNTVMVQTYKEVWADNFEGNSINSNNWSFETGKTGWGNQEWQDYKSSGYYEVKNGMLCIKPTIYYNTKTRQFDKSKVYSTRMYTKNKKTFKYGKMEIRAKAAAGKGAWCAGWMLGDGTGDSRGWPYDGEIDIMESMNGATPQTVHCGWYNNQSWSHGNKNFSSGISQQQAANEFHTYGCIWTEDYIQFTVDGVYKGKYAPKKMYSYLQSKANATELWDGAFMHPFFFILNCAIGGNAAGTVTTDNWTVAETNGDIQKLESYFYVDYVKVYQ